MNGYDQELTDLIARIKADKSIIQPWRNKAASRAEEVQAFVRMGKTTSYAQYDEVGNMNQTKHVRPVMEVTGKLDGPFEGTVKKAPAPAPGENTPMLQPWKTTTLKPEFTCICQPGMRRVDCMAREHVA